MHNNKLLIVIDMQNDFINGSLGTREAEEILPNVKRTIDNYNGYIIYTKDTHNADYLESNEGIKLPVIHCIKNTEGWNIHPLIPYKPVTDNRYLKEIYLKNGFGSPELIEDIISYTKTDTLSEIELIGLCTDICVIVNALTLKAYLPSVTIKVNKSCCAGTTPELHDAALKTMASCQIEITGD